MKNPCRFTFGDSFCMDSTSHILLRKCKNLVLLIYFKSTSLNSLWLFNKAWIFKTLWQGCQRIYEWKKCANDDCDAELGLLARLSVGQTSAALGAESRMTVTSNINTWKLPSLTANKSCCKNLTQHCPWPREHYKIWFITERIIPARFKLFSHVS